MNYGVQKLQDYSACASNFIDFIDVDETSIAVAAEDAEREAREKYKKVVVFQKYVKLLVEHGMPKQKAVDMVAREVSKIESEPYEDYYVTRFGRLIAEALADGSVDIGDKSAAEKLIEQLTRKDVSKWQAEHVASKVLHEDKSKKLSEASELENFSNLIARALDRAEPELDGAARSMVKEIAKMKISEEDIANSGIKIKKTVEEEMGDLRRVTHTAGKGIMYVQDKLGDTAEWAFDKYERFDPVKAALLKGYAVATAISINRGFEYIGKFVPDDVKKEYQKFLDNTTPEEREFWTTIVTLGMGKVATVGIKTLKKIDKIEDVVNKKYHVPDEFIGKTKIDLGDGKYAYASDYWTKYVEFKGNRVYQRDDLIYINRINPEDGMTSLHNMKLGKAHTGPDYSWRVDETYIKVKGQWKYLYRAIDKRGNTVDFYLSPTRNTKAAKRFLSKALRKFKEWEKPASINTDLAHTYAKSIESLKKEGVCPQDLVHRQVKYLNNIIESDHGKLKRLIDPARGFQSMKTAYATIKGFELMRMFKKGQFDALIYNQGLIGEIRLIERQFNIYTT